MLMFKATTSPLGSTYQFHVERGYFCFSHLFNKIIYHTKDYQAPFIIYMHSAIWLVSFREGICRALFLTWLRGFPSASNWKRWITASWQRSSLCRSHLGSSSPWYPEILSVPRALFNNLSCSLLLYCIRLLLTDLRQDSHEDIHSFFAFRDSSATIR